VLRFESRGFFNGGRNFFILVQQIAGINNDKVGIIFTVLFEISSFFVQPAELFTGLRSTARLRIAKQIAAVDYRNF